jgi:hypothetical protein
MRYFMAEKPGRKMAEFLREPLEAAQARLTEFEEEAQKVFKELIRKGRESRKEMAGMVQRLSRQDWGMEDLRGQVTKLRVQGMERASGLASKAGSFRADAIDRLEELQSTVIEFLGVATREQVEELSLELERLARRLDRSERRKPRKGSKRPATEA